MGERGGGMYVDEREAETVRQRAAGWWEQIFLSTHHFSCILLLL